METLILQLSPDDERALAATAAREGCSEHEVAVRAVRAYLVLAAQQEEMAENVRQFYGGEQPPLPPGVRPSRRRP